MENEKRKAGRPTGTSKVRTGQRMEARAVEVLETIATATGENKTELLEKIILEYGMDRVGPYAGSENPALNQAAEVLDTALNKTRAEYVEEVAAGKWGKTGN